MKRHYIDKLFVLSNNRDMKKLIAVLLLALLFVPLSVAHAATPIVCIDPGHGGTDPGASYQTITEKQETLDIGLRLKTLLTNAGYQVIMTRTTDTTLSNAQRAATCNNAGATELVAIHLNAASNHTTDYTFGLYGKKNKDYAFAKTVNTAMGQLANAANTGTIQNNGITNFADGTLLKANMPATLAETVFITSDYEYGLLTDGTGNRQQQIAQALYNGLASWLTNH